MGLHSTLEHQPAADAPDQVRRRFCQRTRSPCSAKSAAHRRTGRRRRVTAFVGTEEINTNDKHRPTARHGRLEHIGDALKAYEIKRWPEGKIPGGKG
jgi:hypothetical protein